MSGNHTHQMNKKVLRLSFVIIFVFMLVEAVGGFLTNSLALLSDAGHMFNDAISLAIALVAFKLGEKTASLDKTYGYKRIEILAALLNGVSLIVIAVWIFIEAIQRLRQPEAIATTGMLIISTIGLVVNIVIAIYMMKNSDTEHNLNMRGAYLHVLSDLFGSVAAIVAALFMMGFQVTWIDSVASMIVAALVFRGGIQVTKNALAILMEWGDEGKAKQVLQIIEAHRRVQAVHDFHLWTITSNYDVLTCKIVLQPHVTVQEQCAIIAELEKQLKHEIQHCTIQVNVESAGQLLCEK